MTRAEHRWCVYEDRTGTVRLVDPGTQVNAEQEAQMVGQGHRAVPLQCGEEMRNAFAHGRNSRLKVDAAVPNYAENRAKLEAAMRAMHDLEPWPLGGTKRVYRPRLPRGVRRHVWREISPPLLGEFCTRCETGRRWWRMWCR